MKTPPAARSSGFGVRRGAAPRASRRVPPVKRVLLPLATVAVLTIIVWASLRVLAAPAPTPADAPADQFSSARALAHLSQIARAPHPTGSAENARVRDYIVEQIRSFGPAPAVQSTVAVQPAWGAAFQVENILVRLPGSGDGRAVLMVGHYDGIASGPGAGDNGLSVAALLEALRTLNETGPLGNDVIFLFPDAEEYGLVGAQVFLNEHPWARDVGVVFNFDASDGRGALVLMHTAEEDGWLVRHLGAAKAGIFLKSQQNSGRDERWGQDFDVFQEAGYTAANVNNWTNLAFYHTRLDNVAHLDERKLQSYGAAMVRLARHFGGVDLDQTREGDRVFTSLFDRNVVVHYPAAWTWPLTALTAAGVAATLALGLRGGRLSASNVALCVAALAAALLLTAAVVAIAWSLIRGAHPEAHWQQEIDIYQGVWLLAGLIAFVIAGFIALLGWAGRRLGVANLQAAALVLSLALALFGAISDPLFSYVALWPLLAVTAAVAVSYLIPDEATERYRWLKAGVFWLAAVPTLGVLSPFLARTLVGSTEAGAVAPALTLLAAAGLLVTSIDIALPHPRRTLAAVSAVAGLALLAIGTARSGFSATQPRPHTLFYVLNADSGAARWATLDERPDPWLVQFVPPETAQKSSAEAVLGITAGPRRDFDWLIPSVPAWTSEAPALDAPAPTLTVLADRPDGDARTLRLRVATPRGGRVVSVAAEQPVERATVAGRPVSVYPGWRFTYVGPPADGVELELTLRGAGPSRLTVLDQTDGLPPSLAPRYAFEPPDTMPAILPRWARGYPTFMTRTYVIE